MHSSMLSKLDRIAQVVDGGKLGRLINSPINYFLGIAHRQLIYPITRRSYNVKARLFWGGKMKVALPSGMDIFILGTKADDSEIRLTKYLINNLKSGDRFIDVGAHFGYYAGLAAHIVGNTGMVIAIEPSWAAFNLLKQNTYENQNISIYNSLLGSKPELVSFYEFPTKYAEYNSIDISQYEKMDWFDRKTVKESRRRSVRLDDLITDIKQKINFIKIDVEGSEHEVLLGAKNIIESDRPTISLEYVHATRFNEAHRSAVDLLRGLDYQSYLITAAGDLERVDDIEVSLERRNLESDNIILIQG